MAEGGLEMKRRVAILYSRDDVGLVMWRQKVYGPAMATRLKTEDPEKKVSKLTKIRGGLSAAIKRGAAK